MGKIEASEWLGLAQGDITKFSPSIFNDPNKFRERCDQIIAMLQAAKKARGMPDGEGGPED